MSLGCPWRLQLAQPCCSPCSAFTWPCRGREKRRKRRKRQQPPHCSPLPAGIIHLITMGKANQGRVGNAPQQNSSVQCYLYSFIVMNKGAALGLPGCPLPEQQGKAVLALFLSFSWLLLMELSLCWMTVQAQLSWDNITHSAHPSWVSCSSSTQPSFGFVPPGIFGEEVCFICFPQLDQNPPLKTPKVIL